MGNMGNNSVRLPVTFYCDWMLGKQVATVGEKLKIDFRAEFFNVLNHTVFALPDNNLSSGTFGKSSSTAVDNRQIQFMLKFNF